MKRLIYTAALTAFAALTVFSGCQQSREPVSEPLTTEAVPTAVTAAQATTESTTAAITSPAAEAPTAYVFRHERSDPDDVYDATGFVSVTDVIPDAVTDIRYCSDHNFVGTRIDGYEEPLALLSEETAAALKNAAEDFRKEGYLIKLFDAYRPRRAVAHFAASAALFDLGYIASYSGHSRGSKVDMTLVDALSGKELDMGGGFDFFDESSHPSYSGVTEEQYRNRMLLREVMLQNGFDPCSTEWWDFTLSDEPYPDTYFDFPVSSSVVKYK